MRCARCQGSILRDGNGDLVCLLCGERPAYGPVRELGHSPSWYQRNREHARAYKRDWRRAQRPAAAATGGVGEEIR